ncbi:MAG: type II toxin-antitoxin system VapC family toxin [Xanthomonadales bacterium]|nr:type II toxin-antitoxin system VapC family toxin [Xanthomonadales bacterium]
MIVLDTHILVWWVNDDVALSKAARQAIEHELTTNGDILISSISSWEIALLVKKDRLTLSINIDDWFKLIEKIKTVRFIPVNNQLAIQSVNLPGKFHSDPADRIITALARQHAAVLITADRKINAYLHVTTIC